MEYENFKKIHEDHNGVAVHASEEYQGHSYIVALGNVDGRLGAWVPIEFQSGPVKEAGVNGLTNEALLAILIDRTEYLNSLFPCKENVNALAHMGMALKIFEDRTRDRISRCVEGKNEA